MSESIVEKGKVISLAYRITDENGELFEYRDIPVSYLHGSGSDLFPLIEQALEGKKVGDHVPVTLPPEDGFGRRDPKLTFTDDIKNVPPQFHRIGAEAEMKNDRGETRTFYVSKIEGDKLTVDGNHALA
ncbi:MAG TPA: peptidylprolyl isomerase, partial [Acidiferrobacteraceae bacterium]|nr:peptidylprolyl isomerase [Acidiferrobacteraceae bacterium]